MKGNNAKQNEIKESKDLALHYMQTLVDVARESFCEVQGTYQRAEFFKIS